MTLSINNEMVKKMISKEYLAKTILSLVLLVSFVISFIFYAASGNFRRKIFIFPSADSGQYVIEYRNLASKPVQGSVQLYVDELLLGSQIERTKMLFTPGTRVLSCFQRGNVLFLNLSADILSVSDSAIDIKEGIELLKKNIKKNFPKIETIKVFVDGKIAFEK